MVNLLLIKANSDKRSVEGSVQLWLLLVTVLLNTLCTVHVFSNVNGPWEDKFYNNCKLLLIEGLSGRRK